MKLFAAIILLMVFPGCTFYWLSDTAERDGVRATKTTIANSPCWAPPPAPVHAPVTATTQMAQTGANEWQARPAAGPTSNSAGSRGQLLFYIGGGLLLVVGAFLGWWTKSLSLGLYVAASGIGIIVVGRVLLSGPWALIMFGVAILAIIVYAAWKMWRKSFAFRTVVTGIQELPEEFKEKVLESIEETAVGTNGSKTSKRRLQAEVDPIVEKLNKKKSPK